jgi:hypothetical protein
MRTAVVTVALVALAAGCGSNSEKNQTQALPQGSEPVKLDPGDFTSQIDNPYWPMKPRGRWVYREGKARDVVTVTSTTKKIMGIEAVVVHDVLTEDGEVTEDTFDWYAQDASGNVWYMGEDTKELDGGKVVSTEGSWEAGVDGAQPGVIVPAKPEVGMTYRQEYYKGEAEDAGEVLSLDARETVPYGSFDGLLKTKDYSPLEPKVVEHKFYAKGVGPILAITVSGGSDREELIQFNSGR